MQAGFHGAVFRYPATCFVTRSIGAQKVQYLQVDQYGPNLRHPSGTGSRPDPPKTSTADDRR